MSRLKHATDPIALAAAAAAIAVAIRLADPSLTGETEPG
jgi:hypothetical protein